MRSMMAAMLLMEAGVDGARLYNLEDGILGWYALFEDIRVDERLSMAARTSREGRG